MELWGSYWTAGLLWGVLLGRGQAVQQEQSALVHVWVQQDASSSVLLQGEVVQKADRSSSEGQLHGDLKLIKEDHEGKKIYSKSEGDDDDKDEGEKMKLWIGVVPVQIEKGSVPNQESFTAAVVNKMRRALVLGASALILLVLNQNTVREMDLSEVLTKPIIIIQSSENVTKLFSALLRGLHATARITFKTFLQNNLGVTLTLWSSCGRSRWGRFGEWQGVVCTGETNSPEQKYLQQLWNTVVFIALLLSTGVMVQARWQNQEHQPNEQLQVHLKQDLLNQLSELNSKKYTEQPHWNHQNQEAESCAVCLESYTHNQWLRVLPCLHEFHRDCVDPWLLLQQTCPLCKRSVIGMSLTSITSGHLK